MRILHLCWGLGTSNGAANIARLIAGEQRAAGHEVLLASRPARAQLRAADQVWCHCGWYWVFWLVALCKRRLQGLSVSSGGARSSATADELELVPSGALKHPLKSRAPCTFNLHWMPEACYDPVRLKYHGWKKRLVGPIERWALRRADVLVATCPAEADWIRNYVGKGCPKIGVTDIRRFFDLQEGAAGMPPQRGCGALPPQRGCGALPPQRGCGILPPQRRDLHILYLGRRHPLKGTRYLEAAIRDLNHSPQPQPSPQSFPQPDSATYSLRLVSDHTGEELARDWDWCDVLCLPTLSDNFGLVVAEALVRGKRVVTTDGAPAWDPSVTGTDYGGRLVYLRSYRDGTDAARVELLKGALRCGA